LIGVFVDITKRKDQEDINTLLGRVVSSENNVVFVVRNSTHKIIYISDNTLKAFGFTSENYINRLLESWVCDFIHVNDRSLFHEFIEGSKWPETEEIKLILNNKQIRIVRLSRFKHNNYYALRFSDITDKYSDETRSYFLKYSTEIAGIHICAVSRKSFKSETAEQKILKKRNSCHNMLQLNDAMIKILNIPESELGDIDGRKFIELEYWFNSFHPDYKEREIRYWKDGKWPDKRRYKVITSSGEEKLIQAKLYPGNKGYEFSVDTDITEIVQEEKTKYLKKNKKLMKLLLKHNIPMNEIAEAAGMTVDEVDVYRKN